jgi:hypothetical protein
LRYIERNKIIYRRNPITDLPDEVTKDYMYFKSGTHQCYELFRSKALITTHKSLVWHLTVLWYLNPNLDFDRFKDLAMNVSDKANNFITFTINEKALNDIISLVYSQDLDRPPKNKIRKIIFKDNCLLSVTDKLKIVGSIIGKSKKADEYDIYEAMLLINDENKKITINKLSEQLKVTTRTIYRNMSKQLKYEKKKMNESLNEKVQHTKLHTI